MFVAIEGLSKCIEMCVAIEGLSKCIEMFAAIEGLSKCIEMQHEWMAHFSNLYEINFYGIYRTAKIEKIPSSIHPSLFL